MDWDEYGRRLTAEFARAGHTKFCIHNAARDVDADAVAAFSTTLEGATDEKPMQRFLEEHPAMLAGEINALCRWVFPQVRLGGKYVADFLTARIDSTGVKWVLVELESPRVKSLFTQEGVQAKQLRKGLTQISDWRRWLAENLDMARKPGALGGLGLIDFPSALPSALLIIGRANDRTEDARPRLEQLMVANAVSIRSYDWLLREVSHRRDWRAKWGSTCDECPATS
jgi:hypothetical protein